MMATLALSLGVPASSEDFNNKNSLSHEQDTDLPDSFSDQNPTPTVSQI